MVLTAFFQDRLQEFVCLNGEKKTEAIVLRRDVLGTRKDVPLRISVSASPWVISGGMDEPVQFYHHGVYSKIQEIRPGHAFHVVTAAQEQIDLLCCADGGGIPVMEKYVLPAGRSITVGTAPDSTFTFTCHSYISRHHARLDFSRSAWYVTDLSTNGTFVNGRRIRGAVRLHFGDIIQIFGLKLVYFGAVLAVCSLCGTLRPSENGLPPYDVRKNALGVGGAGQPQPYFNRPPRSLPTIYTDTVQIEPPPAQQQRRKKSLLTTIGPSLTMALPMMLGFGMMTFSMSGSGHHGFLGMGVVTALGSAVTGAVWAVINLNNQEQEEMDSSRQRFHAYGNYLIRLSKQLAEKYRQNDLAMNRMYPDTAACLKYGRTNGNLWNRNVSQEDFLYERLGLGDIPFQVGISVQKKEFMPVPDKLQEYAAMIQSEYRILHRVPVGVDLMCHPLIGLVGRDGRQSAAEMAQTILCQVAASCCYTDVKIVLLNRDSGAAAQKMWEFCRWLPHCWSADRTTRFFSMSATEEESISYELVKVLRRRAEAGNAAAGKPHYVIVVTDIGLMEDNLLSAYLLHPNRAYGVTALLLGRSYAELPNSCNFAIEIAGEHCFVNDMLDVSRGKICITRDRVQPDELNRMARTLANIRVEEREADQDIPNSVEFLEMYGVSSTAQLQIAKRWDLNNTCDSMRVPIGVRAGNQLCYLDIHEKFHGPHGLVAGTTGSGKSEILQSYILSLCIHFGPEDVGFLLIDYKGGGMANLFERLPHLMGQISNLSGNQIRRAMISIQSEIVRRQRLFSEAGVNSINQYTQMYKNGECSVPIPHLIILIDEFAELRKAEPEFMKELISVAQVGRSLGVHLILATQKPSGTVDDNIRSNSKFRLCLRVQDRQDSNDMLHRPDAAYLTQAGACILQVGNDEIFEPFQSAWSGANYDEENAGSHNLATLLTRTGKSAVPGNRMKLKRREKNRVRWYADLVRAVRQYCGGHPEQLTGQPDEAACAEILRLMEAGGRHGSKRQRLHHLDTFVRLWTAHAAGLTDETEIASAILQAAGPDCRLPEMEEQTQLDAIVDALAETAAHKSCPPVMKLWLPVLPRRISLSELQGWEQQSYAGGAWQRQQGGWSLETRIGLLDDPARQLQTPLCLDFARDGHCAVIGTVVSGKSTFLQTVLYGLVNAYSPDVLHAYLIDFSSRMLGIFDGVPHVGGVVFENEPEKLDKLFYLLGDVLQERKKLLQGGSYQEYAARHGTKLPAVLLVIDNYAGFREKTEGKYEQQMMQLSREGIGYGVYLLLSASGFGMNEISSRMAENLRTIFCLELTDKFKYAEALRMTGLSILPESGVHGRGLVRMDGRCLEFQTACIGEQEDEYSRGQQAQKLFERMRRAWTGSAARSIPEIPEDPVASQLEALPEYREAAQSAGLLPVGYDQGTAMLYSISLETLYTYLILGTPHSGKSNALQLVLHACAGKPGADIAVCAAPDSKLMQAGRTLGADCIASDAELFAFFKRLTGVFAERNRVKQECVKKGMTDVEIYQTMLRFPPVFLLIDDLTAFFTMVYQPSEGVGTMHRFAENMMSRGALHQIYLFGCANVSDHARLAAYPAYTAFAARHEGMLLGTSTQSQRVLEFGKQAYADSMKTLPKGIAAVTENREEGAPVRRVVLPLAGR